MKIFFTTILYLCLIQTNITKLISGKYYSQNLSNYQKRRYLANNENNLVQNENPDLENTKNSETGISQEIESQEILNPFKSETPELETEEQFEKFENGGINLNPEIVQDKTSQENLQNINNVQNFNNIINNQNITNGQEAIQNINSSQELSSNLKNILNSTLKNTSGQNPIIVINHAPKTHYTTYQNADPYQNFNNVYNQFENSGNFSNNKVIRYNSNKWKTQNEDFITSDDINVLIEVLGNIWDIYQRFFQALPQTNKDDKGAMEKTMDILKFYAEMRNFVKKVFLEKDELFGDIKFLESRVSLLKFKTEDDMIRFYNLGYKYENLKIKMEKTENSKKDFLQSQAKLNEINERFETDVKSILASAYDLSKLNQFFTNEIQEITKNGSDNDVLNALDKFDKILMMTIRIIELKIEVEESVKNIKEGVEELKKYRLEVEDVVIKMEKDLDGSIKEVEQKKKEESFEGLIMSFGVLVIGLLF